MANQTEDATTHFLTNAKVRGWNSSVDAMGKVTSILDVPSTQKTNAEMLHAFYPEECLAGIKNGATLYAVSGTMSCPDIESIGETPCAFIRNVFIGQESLLNKCA